MAYIGRSNDKISNIEVLDAITFTDSAGPYNITKSSVAFVPITPNALVNAVGTQFIYAAFAESPIVSSNDTPGVAR